MISLIRSGKIYFVTILFLCLPSLQAEPRYLLFNVSPGRDWRQEDPSSIRPALFHDFANTLKNAQNLDLRPGLAFTLSILQSPSGVLIDCLQKLFQSSLDSGVPIMIALDGQNWWEERRDLWNWWDPEAPGYNPANVFNVEWTGWSPALAVKGGWRNWGTQIRVSPAPNLASPQFLEENRKTLSLLLPVIRDWSVSLPAEKQHLFAGLKVGWETSIGYNAYFYPDGNSFFERWPDFDTQDPHTGLAASKGLSGGLLQLGYAAVMTAGLKDHGILTRDDIAQVTKNYLSFLSRLAHESGINREKIFTHQGGVCPPYEIHLPFWAALNEWSFPGWSFYWGDPESSGDLGKQLDQAGVARWGASEWWWPAEDAAGWADHFEKTLRFRDCRFICAYNWNQGGVESIPSALEGIELLCRRWKE
ncbi:MAG: hypothetical protein KJ050_14430 [Candidatus Omnitrophica bacterium]|nr:hypothetical protein [bacterium]MCC6731829.1 hypothetical protein [Candidatus Omnitrophota bacterium]MBV6482337.1 hypothetical protein [bacterium]MCK6497815.1 hypothetical protein [bacterium]MCL4736125.1 hypothetical protein [Candidatus Omnitrophota bacterium]